MRITCGVNALTPCQAPCWRSPTSTTAVQSAFRGPYPPYASRRPHPPHARPHAGPRRPPWRGSRRNGTARLITGSTDPTDGRSRFVTMKEYCTPHTSCPECQFKTLTEQDEDVRPVTRVTAIAPGAVPAKLRARGARQPWLSRVRYHRKWHDSPLQSGPMT